MSASQEDVAVANPPTGTDFLRLIQDAEQRCMEETWQTLPQAGKNVPACLVSLGDLLGLTYQASSCAWGCHGPDHTANHLAARAANLASASLRCLSVGYYDESLVLTRSIGELANLLVFFVRQPLEFQRWKQTDRSERLKRYSPVQVRLACERRGIEPAIDQAHYALLSEAGTHVTPATTPEAHNSKRRAVLGGIFQLPGAILTLTELSAATAVAAHQASRLLTLPDDVVSQFDETTQALINSLPGIDITNINDLLESLD